MSPNQPVGLDLLALAEDVAFGRRSLDNVIDQIAVRTPDDRERRRAVAELQSLVVALAGVRSHARATATTPRPVGGSAARDLVVEPRRVMARRSSFGLRAAAAGGVALAAVVAVAVLVTSIRPVSTAGGASPDAAATSGVAATASATASGSVAPSGSPGAAVSPAPASTGGASVAPSATASPSRAPSPTASGFDVEALPAGAPKLAFWSDGETRGKITIWYWSPSVSPALSRGLDIDTWTNGAFTTQVAVSPNGERIAVAEFGGPGSNLNRTRVFSASGQRLWATSAGAAPAIDLVWSTDGSELALGAIPGPWTVLIFSPNGQVDPITYDVGGGNAYRLLGFAPDGAHLIGYETSGEAAFTIKPVSLDLAHGAVAFTPIGQFPARMPSNGTTASLLNRINPATGDVLVIANDAKGPADWTLRSNGQEASFGLDLQWDLTWADASTVAMLGAGTSPLVPRPTGSATVTTGYLALFTTTGPGTAPRELLAFPGLAVPGGAGGLPVGLISARVGFALLYVGAPPCCVGTGQNGYSQLLLIDVHSQHHVTSELPAGTPADLQLLFAGWIGATP